MKNVTKLNPPTILMFDKQKYKVFPNTFKDILLLHKELEELPAYSY
ncbi:16738_t:CDS:2 [Funneliformis mosseae]|uniref:16738_t:CDS:1 n=1 Tax=Funneliformis mosseae TaxID=27381 RepID=A0A9N8Z700_FUNMO|nr:16738_t:CDS:2 [Funneliformis mosseae]